MAFSCLANGVPPAVVRIEDRASYMDLLGSENVNGLADYLSQLSDYERRRIEHFTSASFPALELPDFPTDAH